MILTLALLAAQAQDLTLQPGAVLNGNANNSRSHVQCDNFNRADGPMGGNWTQMSGSQSILSNQGYGNVGTGNQWMQHTLANGTASSNKTSIDFAANPAGTLKYVAAVSGVGAGAGFYVKVQSQGSTLYNYLGFYVGFNGGGGSYGQFAAITPVASGRIDVWYNAGTDKMVLDIDEFNNGSIDYSYTSNGAASSTGSLAATGHGLGTYGDQLYDNFSTNGGCSGPPVFTLAKAGTCPGAMTLSTTNGVPNNNVAYIYGNAGTKTKPGGVCAGTTVSIANPKKLAIVAGNPGGTTSYPFNANAALCGQTIQAVLVGVGPCTVSNTVIL